MFTIKLTDLHLDLTKFKMSFHLHCSTLVGETRTPPVQQTKSQTKSPAIPPTSGLGQSETREAATKQVERACEQLTRNGQSPESTVLRKVRRNGRQEVYEAGREGHQRRKQGVCRQTDGTEAERNFVRVLKKRF